MRQKFKREKNKSFINYAQICKKRTFPIKHKGS